MRIRASLFVIFSIVFVSAAAAQGSPSSSSMQLYESLQKFQLSGSASVHDVMLQRDRGQMTFIDGTIYFQTPIDGHVYGAVFIGTGKFHAAAPPVKFEQDNLRRLIHADSVDSDFKTAVLRFTDDTYETLGKGNAMAAVMSADAVKLVDGYDDRMAYETGANISARLAESILNHESPGFFMAEFDKGKLGRFSFVWDAQTRIPSEIFGINGGEKGLIFHHDSLIRENDDWMAFFAQENYPGVHREFPDAYDQVEIRDHLIALDLRHPGIHFRYNDRMTMEVQQDGLRAVQFSIDTNTVLVDVRADPNRMELASAETDDNKPLEAVQGPNDKTVVVFLPTTVNRGQKITIQLGFDLVKRKSASGFSPIFYPYARSWYPRHGYRQRSMFRVRFIHSKRYRPIGLGKQISEGSWSKDHSYLDTEWDTDTPVPSYGYEFLDKTIRNCKDFDWEIKTAEAMVPAILYNECSSAEIKFNQGEITNTLQYFNELFGAFPYPELPPHFGVFSPFTAGRNAFLQFGLDMAADWWGADITARSYRDQWMVDGLRGYSALLYEKRRRGDGDFRYFLSSEREDLGFVPVTAVGAASGLTAELGPIILGQRLRTRESLNAFGDIVVRKGGLIFRMLDFLFTDPATQDDKAFWDMLKEFEKAHRRDSASTEDLIAVANKNFANSPIARQYGLKDLNWFFDQWVYAAGFPSYKLVYRLEAQPDGSAMLKGNVFQEGVEDNPKWFMPLPVTVTFGKGKVEHYTVAVTGPTAEINLNLPGMPEKVELDPELFVISRKTLTQKER